MLHRLAAAFAVVLALATPANADTLVVTAARMVDVERGRYVDNPVIVVTDGRITSVGAAVPADLPAGARRLDLPDLTLLPGLIDMHVHLDGTPYVSGFTALEYADDFGVVLQAPHARATLMAGFTTVRNLGGGSSRTSPFVRPSTAAFWKGRGSYRRAPRSGRPAATATLPACRDRWSSAIPSTPTASKLRVTASARCANTGPR